MRLEGRHLILRADGGSQIGMGHVMRCLALGQEWCDLGGSVTIATVGADASVESRFAREGIRIVPVRGESGSIDDATATAELAITTGAGCVVIDGYRFGPDFHQVVRDSGVAIACIDDYGHLASYNVDLVVNQNLGSTEALYPARLAATRLLLGTDYALLRRDFLSRPRFRRLVRNGARNVLVTMGGADPENVTGSIVGLLGALSTETRCAIVVGGVNRHHADVVEAARRFGSRMRVVHDVSSLWRLMRWADVAVCAGGTTCWEAAFMSLPSVVIVLAENQAGIAESLDRTGAALSLGAYHDSCASAVGTAVETLLADESRRRGMAARAGALVDGLGARRVAVAVATISENL